jgi:hypothetical protein
MKDCLAVLILWTMAVIPALANGEAHDRGGLIGTMPRRGSRMSTYKAPWQTVPLLAADRFLARLGLLSGEPTRNFNPVLQ